MSWRQSWANRVNFNKPATYKLIPSTGYECDEQRKLKVSWRNKKKREMEMNDNNRNRNNEKKWI